MDIYWWGRYTEDLKNEGYIENGEEPPYKIITHNGKWTVIKFYGDGAIYSCCENCEFIHPCYKIEDYLMTTYDLDNEYNYCPICGEYMHKYNNQEEP